MQPCARCHRTTRTVVFVNDLGYGPTCALKVQDQLPLKPKRARIGIRARRRQDVRQGSLLEVQPCA